MSDMAILVRRETGMKQRMRNSYGKGLAIRSAPSLALITARDSVKRRQGYRRGGY